MSSIKRILSMMLAVAIVISGFMVPPKASAAPVRVTVWDKYDTKMVWTDGDWEYQGFSGGSAWGYPGYRITSSGQFELTGEWGIGDGYRYEFWSNGWLNRYQSGVEMVGSNWQSGYHWWYQRYAKQVKARGNLIQSNLVGAYPDNGLHTDGYWYVKKTINNNIPAITISNAGDKTLYNDGGTFSISGSAQDLDNDNITVSATIGGVTKSTVLTGTSTAKTWTLTWAGSELPVGVYTKPTVVASDGKSESSAAYNGKLVINAQVYYFWSKFNTRVTGGWKLIDDGTVWHALKMYERILESQNYSYNFPNDIFYNAYDAFHRITGASSLDGLNGNQMIISWGAHPNELAYVNGYYAVSTQESYQWVRIKKYRHPTMSWPDGASMEVYELTDNPPPAEKGTLVQANIKAAQGTYPDDGFHSDGYWYVKSGTVPNNIPVLAVTSSGDKSINLKQGQDTFTLSGQVSDGDADTIRVSAEVGGLLKEVAVSNTSLPKSWTLTFRTSEFAQGGTFNGITVTVDDGRGGVATASYSGTLTINKTPLYYWDKYNVASATVYSGEWVNDFTDSQSELYYYERGGYTDYNYDTNKNIFYLNGWDYPIKEEVYYYNTSGMGANAIHSRYMLTKIIAPLVWITQDHLKVISTQHDIRGTLISSNIQEIDGSYPENGVHSDGYWYVKKATNNLFPVLSVDNSDITINQSATKVILSGTVSDSDGDSVTITATLAGVTKSTNVTGSGAWHLDWSIGDVPEGVYTGISITGNDGNEGIDTITYTGTIIVDKTAPVITVTPDQQTWTSDPISLSIQWSDNLSGINANERKYKLSTSQTAPTSWDTSASEKLDLSIPGEGEWYFHARALDIAGNEATIVAGPFQYQLQPEVPSLKMDAVGADWAEVGWSLPNSSFADGYQYEVLNTVTGRSWTVDYPTDQVREEGLSAGTTYQYRIKAKNHVGESDWSEQFEVLTLPAAVEDLKVAFVPNTSGTVNVSFETVESAESYLLTIKKGADLVYEEDLSTAGTHHVTGLEGGKQYTATVTAKNASGSGQSSVLGFLSLPAAPGEFQSAQIRATEVELSWSASPTASLYDLLRAAVSRYSGSGADISYTFTDTSLESGTEYDYSISAKNESGFGDIAYLNGVLTLPGKTELKVEDIKKDVVSFSIKPIRGAEHYVVLANGLEEKELPSDTEQFEIDSLTPGTEYTFEVYAENRSGAGSSNKVTVRTLPDKPDALAITDIGETTAKLAWSPVPGAEKYKVTVTDAVYFETSSTDVLLNDLLAGTTYQPKVQAGNSSGYGEAIVEMFLTLPASPDVRLENVQANQFTLAWDEVASATKYVVYTEQNELLGEAEETRYTLTDLNPGETHTVYVAAVNETGEGKRSAFTQRTLPAKWGIDPDDPEASHPIIIGDRGEHSVVIIVNPVEGADQYKIVDGGGNVIGIITAPETAKEIDGLESAKEYADWTIIPINDAGEGQAAQVPPFVTLPSTDFTASIGSPTTSSLTISIDSQLVNEVFVYAMGGKELHRGKEKTFTASNLSANKSHTFIVWAENSAGDKTEPKSATGQTLPMPSSDMGSGGSGEVKPESPVKPDKDSEPENPNAGESDNTNKPGFQDIDRSFAKDEILALYDKGIVKGVSDSKFEPNRQVTRVEFASMLVRALELQETSDEALTFEDIQRTAWYAPELSAAVLNGVAKGISAKEFRPFDPITREQAAKMIANAAYKENVPAAQASFKDEELIAVWAKPEVAALTAEQVINGYPDQTFKPKRDLTRAECAVLIYRTLDIV